MVVLYTYSTVGFFTVHISGDTKTYYKIHNRTTKYTFARPSQIRYCILIILSVLDAIEQLQ